MIGIVGTLCYILRYFHVQYSSYRDKVYAFWINVGSKTILSIVYSLVKPI